MRPLSLQHVQCGFGHAFAHHSVSHRMRLVAADEWIRQRTDSAGPSGKCLVTCPLPPHGLAQACRWSFGAVVPGHHIAFLVCQQILSFNRLVSRRKFGGRYVSLSSPSAWQRVENRWQFLVFFLRAHKDKNHCCPARMSPFVSSSNSTLRVCPSVQ